MYLALNHMIWWYDILVSHFLKQIVLFWRIYSSVGVSAYHFSQLVLLIHWLIDTPADYFDNDSFLTFVLCYHLRSREFGSPQCRLRLYVVGVRNDLIDPGDFATMVNFLRGFLPSVHKPSTIDAVVHAAEVTCSTPVSATPNVKDWYVVWGSCE